MTCSSCSPAPTASTPASATLGRPVRIQALAQVYALARARAKQIRQAKLDAVIAFCSRRYNENRDTRHSVAKAHLETMNRIKDLQLSSADPKRDLLDLLRKPHSVPDLVKACKEVLEQIGAELDAAYQVRPKEQSFPVVIQ